MLHINFALFHLLQAVRHREGRRAVVVGHLCVINGSLRLLGGAAGLAAGSLRARHLKCTVPWTSRGGPDTNTWRQHWGGKAGQDVCVFNVSPFNKLNLLFI